MKFNVRSKCEKICEMLFENGYGKWDYTISTDGVLFTPLNIIAGYRIDFDELKFDRLVYSYLKSQYELHKIKIKNPKLSSDEFKNICSNIKNMIKEIKFLDKNEVSVHKEGIDWNLNYNGNWCINIIYRHDELTKACDKIKELQAYIKFIKVLHEKDTRIKFLEKQNKEFKKDYDKQEEIISNYKLQTDILITQNEELESSLEKTQKELDNKYYSKFNYLNNYELVNKILYNFKISYPNIKINIKPIEETETLWIECQNAMSLQITYDMPNKYVHEVLSRHLAYVVEINKLKEKLNKYKNVTDSILNIIEK